VCACGRRSSVRTECLQELWFLRRESRHVDPRDRSSSRAPTGEHITTSDFATTLDVITLDHGHDANLPFALIPARPESGRSVKT